jgi:hypothetical protein
MRCYTASVVRCFVVFENKSQIAVAATATTARPEAGTAGGGWGLRSPPPSGTRWLGHVARMPPQRLPRKPLTCWVPTARPVGRPLMTCAETARKAHCAQQASNLTAGTRWHRTARFGEQPCTTSPYPTRQSPAARPAALLRLRPPSVPAPSPPYRGPRLSHNCDVRGECTSAFTAGDSNHPPHLTRPPRAPAPSSLGCAVVSASRANNARRGPSLLAQLAPQQPQLPSHLALHFAPASLATTLSAV